MASGVKVAEEVKITYDDIKKKKSYRYLVFYIKDEKLIAVEKVGDRAANYSDFLHDLTGSGPDDCRYIHKVTIMKHFCYPLDPLLASSPKKGPLSLD